MTFDTILGICIICFELLSAFILVKIEKMKERKESKTEASKEATTIV